MTNTHETAKISFWPIMIAIGVGNFVAALSSTTVTIMLPVFMQEFSTTIIMVQWVITGYMLASGMVAPMIGYLADRLSLKRTYLFAMVGFTVTSFLVGIAQSIELMIVLRILQGCFGGMIYPLTMSLVYQVIDKERQAFALSIWSVSGVLAPTFGPTVAGLLTDLLSWHWVFFINIPVALVAIVIALKFIPYYTTKPEQEEKFDLKGLISAIVGTYCLLFAFSNISAWGLFSAKTLIVMAVGAVVTAYFIRHELTCENPLLNLKVLKYSNFTWSVIILCLAQITMNASILVMPIYLQDILGYSTTVSAIALALGPMCVFFFVPVIGKLYDRINAKLLLYVLFLVGAASMLFHSRLGLEGTALMVAIAVLIRDMGVGSLSMPATNMGMQDIPVEVSSHASATSSWVRQCVVALAIGLINTFITIRTQSYMAANAAIADAQLQYNTSYTMAMHDLFLLVIGVTLFGLFAVSRMRYQRNK
ncbi:MAG: DHA2 family efflux MFS transporter permease subunit [Peptococcaceae bacterium]|nr:DHA2 family efflux MFS transporter permease subunit [Peptococcaceae bacterium]